MNEKKVATLSIIIENREESGAVNALLSQYGDYIVGRMGIPYRDKNISVICIVMDAPIEVLNAVSGKIGMIKGVSAKLLTSKI